VEPRLLDACRQFEAVMIRPLIESMGLGRMRGWDSDDGDAGSGTGADGLMYSLFTDALALALARDGGLGLGEELARAFAPRQP